MAGALIVAMGGVLGTLIVITKGRTPDIWVFQMTRGEAAAAMASRELHRFGSGIRLPIEPDFNLGRVPTGAAVSPDGSILAVRTYSEIYFFAWPMLGDPVEVAAACFLGTMEPQGEAIAFGSDGTLLLTSEDNRNGEGHLLAVRCAGIVPLGGAVLRGDITVTDTDEDTVASAVGSVSYSWMGFGRNMSGVLEYYYNGFGQDDDEYGVEFLADNPDLLAGAEDGVVQVGARVGSARGIAGAVRTHRAHIHPANQVIVPIAGRRIGPGVHVARGDETGGDAGRGAGLALAASG